MLPPATFSKVSQILCGAFLFLWASANLSADESTPDWPELQVAEPKKKQKPKYEPAPESDERVTFMVYNLRNYLSMERGAKRDTMLPKPDSEIRDLIANIIRVQPDILGVCEIGTQADVNDLKKRLAKAGCDLPHTHLHGGADSYRRLAILSRFPLKTYNSANLYYKYDGKTQKMLRGILDVGIKLPSAEVRFLGVHLKSKRHSEYFDQAQVRRHEGELLRKHAQQLLEKNKHTKLVVFGDFNDTTQSPTLRAVIGSHETPFYLRALDLRASNGTKWTHYWAYQDVYSRFDYVLVSKAMRRFIDTEKSYIFEPNRGNTASDHRPLVISIR